jgi:hypothetical protein
MTQAPDVRHGRYFRSRDLAWLWPDLNLHRRHLRRQRITHLCPPGATDSMFSIFMDSQIRNPYRIGMALHLRNRPAI